MKAAPADQVRLLDVAAADTRIAQLRHRGQNLPEVGALRELGAQRNRVTERLTSAQTAVSDAELAQGRVDQDLENAKARLARNQQRVDAGQVPDAKALSSLVDEIEHLKGRISTLEDQSLEAMQVVEDATGERDALQRERDEIDDQARGLIAKRDQQVASIKNDLATAQADRDAITPHISADLLALYDKLSTRLGVGAAHLERGRCEGCHVESNAADLRRYQQAPKDEVVRCENCDRILVRTETSGLWN